jgi:hypothetical protein
MEVWTRRSRQGGQDKEVRREERTGKGGEDRKGGREQDK